MAYVPRLAKALRGLDLDIVHTHSLKADLLSVPLAPVLRAPIIWHVHDRISRDYLPSGIARAVRTFARWVPQHVIANSQATAKTLLPLPRGWTVAYPGLEHSDFRTDPAAVAKARPVVGILGRIAPTKGQDVFLRAAAAVNRIYPEVRFRVIGTAMFGEQAFERSLRDLSIELGIAHRVAFVGFAEDPGAALRELTICVHASPVPEPFGQVIVEAMAARVPTVVTDAGGASEIVHDGDHVIARLAAPGRADQIASQIVWLLENAEGAMELSGSAFESVRRRFAIEQTAAAVMAAWDKVQ
jgi:glycosyltransferase involved in cell wall biosynthesis